MKKRNKNNIRRQNKPAMVLLITMVLLVVLATLGYTLTSRVAAQRHRDHYIIDYQSARYACDSAIKYALATLEDVNIPNPISRPNEPDFSDLFALTEQEYQQLLDELAEQQKLENIDNIEDTEKNNLLKAMSLLAGMNSSKDSNDPNSIDDINDVNSLPGSDFADSNEQPPVNITGPYGPTWPFIKEKMEFKIGTAKVIITIEDENAKYPLGWALLEDEETQREAEAGFKTFCEWMDVNEPEIESLLEELYEITEVKTFKLEFKPIKTTKVTEAKTSRSRRGRRFKRKVTKKITIPASIHYTDFARLFHSSMLNIDVLAKPTVISDTRKESALKYMGMWASSKVNINTAPRHVLEAAFTFGGNAENIADEIIVNRKIEPFKDIDALKKALFQYSDSIRKSEEYITTKSTFFTIRVTAISGVAEASAVIAIRKEGKKTERLAVISG